MKTRLLRHTGFWAVGMLLLLLVSCSFAFRFFREEMDGIRAQQHARRQLAGQVALWNQLQAELSRQISGEAAGLEMILSGIADTGKIQFEAEPSRLMAGGIRLRRGVITFEALTWEELRLLLLRVEVPGAGWTLNGLEITPGESGLRGRLQMESLDKPGVVPQE